MIASDYRNGVVHNGLESLSPDSMEIPEEAAATLAIDVDSDIKKNAMMSRTGSGTMVHLAMPVMTRMSVIFRNRRQNHPVYVNTLIFS